jgi:hypothetical protein
MFKKGFVFAVGLLTAVVAWAAAPTLDDVLQADKAGDYARAEGMMDQVLREHPNNAYAHFFQAHLLAKQSKLTAGRDELEKAQKLAPTLSFAKPAVVQELKAELAGQSSQPADTHAAGGGAHSSMSSRVLIALVIVAVLWFFLRSRRQRVVLGQGGNGPSPMAYPADAPMPPQAGGGGMRPSVMGGLASGAVLGAGVSVGEALMHKVLGLGDGAQRTGLFASAATPSMAAAHNAGEADFSPNNPQVGWNNGNDDFGPNNEGGNAGSSNDWG